MSTENPIEQLSRDISALQSDISNLHSKVRLSSPRSTIEELTTKVNGLASHIADLRARGYAFNAEWEGRANDWPAQWNVLRDTALRQIDEQTTWLEQDLRPIETEMPQLLTWANAPDTARPIYTQLKAMADNLNSKVSAVESTITGGYNAFKSELDKLADQLKKVEWMLKQLDEATFKLLPSESGIMAVEAACYQQVNKKQDSDPDGVLFLTDQRLILEQKEEVATKKFLFITTSKEKVQKVVLDAPIGKIEKVDSIDKGLFGHEDHLEVHFASGVSTRMAHLHLKGQDNELWKTLIERAKAGGFDNDRALALDQAAVDKVKSAPTKCPSCGGALTQTIVRGMDSIRCEFCGTVIRL